MMPSAMPEYSSSASFSALRVSLAYWLVAALSVPGPWISLGKVTSVPDPPDVPSPSDPDPVDPDPSDADPPDAVG